MSLGKLMAAERNALWTVTDPRGLSITLTGDVWQEVTRKHIDMPPFFETVKLTASDPDEIYLDPESTASRGTGARIYRYSRRIPGASRPPMRMATIIKVVAEAGGHKGYVETAFRTERIPNRLVLEWQR